MLCIIKIFNSLYLHVVNIYLIFKLNIGRFEIFWIFFIVIIQSEHLPNGTQHAAGQSSVKKSLINEVRFHRTAGMV